MVKGLNISNKEKDKKLNELLSIPLYNKGKGLGIGNMTSQILAVYYLSEVDHFIKEKLVVKYYIRYMDDLVILGSDIEYLKFVYNMVRRKMNQYGLALNSKSGIHELSRGFSFLGYTYKLSNKIVIRVNNATFRRVSKHLSSLVKYDVEMFKQSMISYKGFFSLSFGKNNC